MKYQAYFDILRTHVFINFGTAVTTPKKTKHSVWCSRLNLEMLLAWIITSVLWIKIFIANYTATDRYQ